MGSPAENIYAEGYPDGTLCLSLGHMTLSYVLAILICNLIHPLLGAAYLALLLAALLAGLKYRCRYCWYFGKTCHAGLGKVAGLLFEKGEAQEFAKSSNVVPVAVLSFASLLLPLAAILIRTIAAFSWGNLGLLAAYFIAVVVGGFAIRPRFFCSHCRQGELRCPAYEHMQDKAKARDQ